MNLNDTVSRSKLHRLAIWCKTERLQGFLVLFFCTCLSRCGEQSLQHVHEGAIRISVSPKSFLFFRVGSAGRRATPRGFVDGAVTTPCRLDVVLDCTETTDEIKATSPWDGDKLLNNQCARRRLHVTGSIEETWYPMLPLLSRRAPSAGLALLSFPTLLAAPLSANVAPGATCRRTRRIGFPASGLVTCCSECRGGSGP